MRAWDLGGAGCFVVAVAFTDLGDPCFATRKAMQWGYRKLAHGPMGNKQTHTYAWINDLLPRV